MKRSRGQGMIEYGIILVLVAVVVIATLVLLGPPISVCFCASRSELELPTVLPTAVPTPKKLPSGKEDCKRYGVPLC